MYVIILNIIYLLILSTKEWQGLFHSGSVVGTFVANLVVAKGVRRVLELEVRSANDHSYGTHALSAAGVGLFSYLSFIKIKYYLFRSSMLFFSTQQIPLPFR